MVRYRCMRRVCLLAILVALRLLAQDPKKDPDQIGTRDVSRGINFFSIEREMAVGKQLSQELERHSTLVTDKIITEYVNRLGQKLVAHSDAKIPITIKVIEGDEPNAVTLPGGYIYVQTGLLRTADTEAELAAALAHEIAHVAARHATRQATQGQVAQPAAIPLIFWAAGEASAPAPRTFSSRRLVSWPFNAATNPKPICWGCNTFINPAMIRWEWSTFLKKSSMSTSGNTPNSWPAWRRTTRQPTTGWSTFRRILRRF